MLAKRGSTLGRWRAPAPGTSPRRRRPPGPNSERPAATGRQGLQRSAGHPARLSGVTKRSVSSLTPVVPEATTATIPTTIAMPKPRPAHRHPNLGLAPISMTAGFTEAAEKLRRDSLKIAACALVAATEADPTIKERYSDVGLRRLVRDSEILTERLAMCLASDNPRWLGGFAAWVAPIYRRRGVTLLDLAASRIPEHKAARSS